MEIRIRTAIGKRIETGAEHDILRDALFHGFSELVFGKPAASGHKRTEGSGDRVRFAIAVDGEFATEQMHRNRIVENAGMIEYLVNSAAMGHAKCGSAGASCLHGLSLDELRPQLAGTILPMTWIGWALLSAIFAAATALLAKVGVAHVDSNLATAIRTTVVLVFAWAIALALGRHGEMRLLDRRAIFYLALSGMATGMSWLCYFRALQLGPASRVAPLDKLSVPLVMLFAWLLLGEKLNFAAVAGGLLITAGAVVMVLA